MANADSKMNSEIPTGNDLEKVHGLTRRDFVKYSVGTVACIYLGALNSGCGGGNTTTITGNNFRVVVFSDVHFNPFYDPNLISALVNENDTDKWAGIFQTSNASPLSR